MEIKAYELIINFGIESLTFQINVSELDPKNMQELASLIFQIKRALSDVITGKFSPQNPEEIKKRIVEDQSFHGTSLNENNEHLSDERSADSLRFIFLMENKNSAKILLSVYLHNISNQMFTLSKETYKDRQLISKEILIRGRIAFYNNTKEGERIVKKRVDMNIYALPGYKVLFTGDERGVDKSIINYAKQSLVPGTIYTVKRTYPEQCSANVALEEVDGLFSCLIFDEFTPQSKADDLKHPDNIHVK